MCTRAVRMDRYGVNWQVYSADGERGPLPYVTDVMSSIWSPDRPEAGRSFRTANA